MTDLGGHLHSSRYADNTDLPDTPYEHTVCAVTLALGLLFVASGLYYFFGPDGGMKTTLLTATGGLFALGVVNFFWAAFTGKLCGCKKDGNV